MPAVEIDGGSLHYRREGAGDAVMFVSGLGGAASFWDAQVRAFRDKFSVITFDHRGVGGSTGMPPYTVEQWSADLLRLADHLGLGRFHLVGHSTGGIISQLFAAEHPDRVRTLALGGAWLSPDRRFRDLFALRKDVLVTMGESAYRMLGDLLASSSPWEEDGPAAPSHGTPREIVLARIDALLAYRGDACAARIRAPTLVLAAADDHIVPAYLSQRLAGAIAGSQILLLEAGGHFFPRTRMDRYNAALSDFWASEP
jgi:aminoacrylate hydrolase